MKYFKKQKSKVYPQNLNINWKEDFKMKIIMNKIKELIFNNSLILNKTYQNNKK